MTRTAVLACLALTGCTCACTPFSGSSYTLGDGNVTIVNGVRLEHRRTLTASSEHPPRTLDLTFETADLSVIGIPGATSASAEAEVYEKEAGDAELIFTERGVSLRSLGSIPVHLHRLILKVPAGTPVALKTSMGNLHLSRLSGVPFIRLQVSSGNIDLRELAEVACLEATSSMGDVTVTGSRGIARIALETSSGDVSVMDLDQIGDLTVKTGMGDLTARRIQADRSVTFLSSSGEQTLESVHAPSADLTTSMGDIRVSKSDFDHLKARTSSGDIDCRTSTYRSRDFKTSMGEILEGTLSPCP